ncbi:hypothetical protein EYW49_02135 [Siculibacillus lacustris]|uniref:Uncharacterized protein n=1 Tax=Siculibacillus lacustris TaxID=1549641 RepID=A0A4Q9VX71_9HYPH|nr:hypothetical protein [Siculibacillus lacustris]TBW40978.1 hypothetical protein EYW49_02135 [Siculibacillus lacustris]
MTEDRFGSTSPTRETPAVEATTLTTLALSDTVDLPVCAKALRVWNGTGGKITLLVTPIKNADDGLAGAVPLSVPAGVVGYEAIAVRRIWSTGSTGLAAGLAAGTVEVILLTE